MKLTDATIAKLKLPAGKTEHIEWDDKLAGFGLRLRESGSRNWIVQYKIGAKHRRLTLGSSAMLTAAEARNGWKDQAGGWHDGAAIILANAKQGDDAAAGRAQRRANAASTFGPAAADFLAVQKDRRKPNTYEAIERFINDHWKPLHGLPLASIDRATVAARLRIIQKERGPISADRARANLSKFFSWAIGEGLCDHNPVLGTNKAVPEYVARDRVLSDGELAAIWKAAPDNGYGRIVRLLILTGQRRDEIASLRWSETDLKAKLIGIPAERTKNNRPHDVPLSKDALGIIEAMPQRDGRDLVFGQGQGGFSGWSKAKTALDKAIAEAGAKVEPWRLHDLRRTAATRMADSGVQPHIVEAVLNHVSGHKAGVAGIYNRAAYAAEKRAALETLASYVKTAVAKSEGANVRRMKRA